MEKFGKFLDKIKNLKPISISVNINVPVADIKKGFLKIVRRIKNTWETNRTRIYISIGVIVVCAIGIWLLETLYIQQPKVPTPKEGPLPQVLTENLTKTDLSQTVEVFGPWNSPAIRNGQPVTDFRALVLLLEDGGIKVSLLGVTFPNKNWGVKKPPEIAGMTLDKNTVKIMTNKSRIFTLAVFQPFVFEQRPEMVYLIDDGGKIWGLSAEQTSEITYGIK
jgi:hypothetical protein